MAAVENEVGEPRREANPIPNLLRLGLIDVTCITAATLVSGPTVPPRHSWSQPLDPAHRAARHAASPTVTPFSGAAVTKLKKRQRRRKEFSNSHSAFSQFLTRLPCSSAGPRRIISGRLFQVKMSNYSSGMQCRNSEEGRARVNPIK